MKPFWSDDFDMDLPKIIPDARDLLKTFADFEHADRRKMLDRKAEVQIAAREKL